MSNIFNSRRRQKIVQSVFRPSYTFSGSFYPGYIYPILAQKVMPGDTWQIASNPNLTFQPMVAPVKTNIRVDIRYFYCRNMLVWPNFDQYLTGKQRYGNQAANIVHPYFQDFSIVDSTPDRIVMFFDNLYGIVNKGSNFVYRRVDPLPARMYNMIFNEYYKNEFVGNSVPVILNDGAEGYIQQNYGLQNSCWKKDYYTSALPFPQWGDGVALPAEVILKQISQDDEQLIVSSTGDPLGNMDLRSNGVGQLIGNDELINREAYLDPNGTLGVNIDIREFRTASAIQRFLEKSAVNGNRYAEYMLAHFGVRTPDNSSFRPQYLGGGEQFVNVSPVEQNSESNTTPQGTMAGRGGINGLVGMNHKYFFTEHGWIFALMTIRPDAQYFGGLSRRFQVQSDRYEQYCIPSLQNVGMDVIKNSEIAYTSDDKKNNEDFAYRERYMDYKSFPNEVHGELRGSQNAWVVARNYSGLSAPPQLNNAFMAVPNNVLANNMAVDNYPPITGAIYHDIRVKRPLQYHAQYHF